MLKVLFSYGNRTIAQEAQSDNNTGYTVPLRMYL